jgi:hypothetical protein
MLSSSNRKVLFEGSNDFNVALHLLIQNLGPLPVGQSWPLINKLSVEQALSGVLSEIKTLVPSTDSPAAIGLVVDANGDVQARWDAIRNAFGVHGTAIPLHPVSDGYLQPSPRDPNLWVGAWMMPDNCRKGALEEFLLDLIPHPAVLQHARASAEQGCSLFAAATQELFTPPASPKAVLNSYLSYGPEPALPYGLNVAAQNVFDLAHSSAARYVAWLRSVLAI